MLNFEQAMKDQEDLEGLCRLKTQTHRETYYPNGNYGFAKILKDYAQYPKDISINALIPHGVYLDDTGVFAGELSAPFKTVLNYPDYRIPIWKYLASDNEIIPSASPFLYALTIFKQNFSSALAKVTENRGTIFFHSHSTAGNEVSFDQHKLIAQLNAYLQNIADINSKEISVCLHWQDIQLGLHHFFKIRVLMLSLLVMPVMKISSTVGYI